MTRSPFRPILIALTCAALGGALGGCGRKTGLDLPPSAQAQAAPAAASVDEAPADLGPGSVIDQSLREADPPPAQRSKRKFILDPLLGN